MTRRNVEEELKAKRPHMLSKFYGDINHKYKYLLKINKLKEDPKSLLVSNFEEVQAYLKILKSNKEENIYKQLYLNVKRLSNILYDTEEILFISHEDFNKSLSEYYYLDLLININKNVINFAYSFDFIKNINNDNKKNDKPLRKLIISKIILDFIDNYKNLDNDDEYNEKEVEAIENENKSLIIEKFSILADEIELNLGIDKVIEMKINDLYVEIIYTLMRNKKIEDYKFATNIFKQMDLDSINISKEINEKCLELYNNNNYMQKYLITTSNHLKCPKKIYHYFIIFNYIFKDSLYIYKNPFLSLVKKNITNIIKNELNNVDIYMPKKQFKKFKNVVEKFLDCDYYKQLFNNYLEKVKKEKKNNKFHQIYLDKNKNELRYESFYPQRIFRCKYSSTYITLNGAKVSNENLKTNQNILENKDLPKLNEKEYLYENRTFESHRKGKIDKNNKSKNDILIFIEEIINDKILLEDKNSKQIIFYCLPNKKWNKIIFSDKSQKEFRINENLVIYIFNKYFKGEEDKLLIYNKTSQSKITTIKDYSFPFGLNGFAVMDNNILICPCKKDKKKGILSIYCENNKIFHLNFEETNNFKATSICPLLNDKLKETNYFLIAGVDGDKKVKIQLVKFIYDYKSNKMELKIIIQNIPIKNDGNENFSNFQKPIYKIKQSKITGHIFMYSDKKIYHFSPPNINQYLISDKNKESDIISEENIKIEKLFEEYENKLEFNDFTKSIDSS